MQKMHIAGSDKPVALYSLGCLPQREAAGGKLRVAVGADLWALTFPAVFVIRQGELFEVSSTEQGEIIRLPLEQAFADLEAIGNHLAELASLAGQGRGRLAAQQWTAREHPIECNAWLHQLRAALLEGEQSGFGGRTPQEIREAVSERLTKGRGL